MKYDNVINLINDMASNFMVLDGQKVDVPAAGKLLNQLEEVIKEADAQEIKPLKRVATGINSLLEKIVLNAVEQKEGGRAFGEGLIRMQEISSSVKNKGSYDEDIEEYMQSLAELTGSTLEEEEKPGAENDACKVENESPPETGGREEKFEVQDESLLKDFITEALEYIDEIEVNILNLEQDPENTEYVNAIFRPFHSIKGVAGFLDLKEIRDLAHILEDLLDRVRSNELPVNPTLIDIILDGADVLKEMITSLKEILDGERDVPAVRDISKLRHRIDTVDQRIDSEDKAKKLGTILVEDGVITEEALEDSLKIAEGPPRQKVGEALIKGGKATPKQVTGALRKQAAQATNADTIRVDVSKLDDLIDMIGELVITQAMVRQNPVVQGSSDEKLGRHVSQLASITSELQRTSTSLRMVPIKQTFQRMSRLVRDLTRSSRKIATVEVVGEDTEVDRNMIEEIYNPLVHMVRNSVDHGIGTPEERVKSGKPEAGLIQLKAYHKGGNIVIEITDDGMGLNKKKILKRAVEKGLMKESDILSDNELYKLLFLPGFSTAERVTEISGRGVGMDVVKQAVEKLRGKIEVSSTEGKGSTFATFFPLTMAIIDGMIVRVGKEKYIIPATAIRQLLRPLRESYSNVVGKGEMLNVMNKLLPLVRLHEVFDVKPDSENPWDALVVVVEAENRSKCLLVDEVIGKEEVVIKGLGAGLRNIEGVSGGAIAGDGNIALILDPGSLFALSET
ncbi:MAG: chemotaxis protein CheA [Syntrophales bacterium]|nr:chemotaxis protein CheA [Syntrophales bacterium]